MSSLFQTISLQEWWEETPQLPVVDIREENDENQERLSVPEEVTIVELPFSTLISGERSCELPPRSLSFVVLLDPSTQDVLEIREFFGQVVSKATQQSRKPWLVRHVLLANKALWDEARELNILQSRDIHKDRGVAFQPLPRLWRPDPVVERVLWPLLQQQLIETTIDKHDDTVAEIWDLGSGAGRDACFLAEQIKALSGLEGPRYRVVGIDHHKGSAKRCLPLWKHRQVDDCTRALNIDLRKMDQVQHELSQQQHVLCLYAVRFYHPPILHYLAKDAPLAADTLFAMSHFCKPHPGARWDFDHPKEKSVLERNELEELFGEDDAWDILHNEIANDGDHGRTLIQFVARRLR